MNGITVKWIVRDKHHCWGRYRIRGTRVPIFILKERFRAGESIRELADDYELPYDAIESAINFRKKQQPAEVEE